MDISSPPIAPTTVMNRSADSLTTVSSSNVTSSSSKRTRNSTSANILPVVTKSGRTVKVTPVMADHLARIYFCADESDDAADNFVLLATDNDVLLSSENVPTSYTNIASRPDKLDWYAAIDSENDSLRKHGVLELGPSLPSGKNLIKAKYIFKKKSDGRFKARLVARGYTQVEGIDYFDVFAPVVSKNTLRLLLALAAVNDWDITHLDVETAFLYGDLEEDIYMEAPAGSYFPKGSILRLRKSLYGLKQAPRQWNR